MKQKIDYMLYILLLIITIYYMNQKLIHFNFEYFYYINQIMDNDGVDEYHHFLMLILMKWREERGREGERERGREERREQRAESREEESYFRISFITTRAVWQEG